MDPPNPSRAPGAELWIASYDHEKGSSRNGGTGVAWADARGLRKRRRPGRQDAASCRRPVDRLDRSRGVAKNHAKGGSRPALRAEGLRQHFPEEIGRASVRERGCTDV